MMGVKVLEVMDAEIGAILNTQPMVEFSLDAERKAAYAKHLSEMKEARAAVAELIDKADFLVEGLSEDGHVAWPTRVMMLRAALARCNGGAA